MTPTPTATEPDVTPPPEGTPDAALVARLCPQCGSDNVRESSTRRGMDLLPANIGKDAYRCRGCRARFYLKRQTAEPVTASGQRRRKSSRKKEPLWKHPALKRHMNEIAIACGSLVVFAVFLYLLARSGISL